METEDNKSSTIKEFNGKPREVNLVAWWGTIIGLCVIIAAGSIFISRAYLANHRENDKNWRPGKIGRLEEDLEAINRDGKTVQLSQLRGKVYVVGYQYTDCPAGCLGMAAVMKDLLTKFGADPRFHLVSISANPKEDTPEKMDAWVKDKGVESPRWWFLTGDEEIIAKYVLNHFKLISTQENTDKAKIATEGRWSHDQRLFIVDEKANIRGYYGVMDSHGGPTAIKLLHRDLEMVLNPSKKLEDFDPIPFPKMPE